GHLGARRAPVAHPALPAGARLRHPERADRRQRRARQLCGDAREPGCGPRRWWSALHRGAHLPHGRAHDERRPEQVPRGRGDAVLERARPDLAFRGVSARSRGRGGVLPRGGDRCRGSGGGSACPHHGDARPAGDEGLRARVHGAASAARRAGGVVRRLPGRLRGGGVVTERMLPMAKAINEGLRAAMAADEKVILMGEDIGTLGGVFRVTEHLKSEFGENRVLDTPLAESGIIGTAIGLAMRGYRPVCEIQFDGFIFPGFDQITTQLAKLTYRHEGAARFPVVIRVPYGGHIGAVEHHQESPEAYFAHTAGLRLVSPATSNDAYWMIQQAIASDDPVLFFEPKARYWQRGEVADDGVPFPLHQSRVVREGTQVTLVGHGAMVSMLLQAAEV